LIKLTNSKGRNMKIVNLCKGIAFAVIGCGLTASVLAADTTVTMTGVHLCCNSCVKGADAAVGSAAGAKATIDAPKGTVAITAPDPETAQKAVDALVAAGYFGTSSDGSIKVAAPANVPDAKVQELKVTNVHLCCGKCVAAMKTVLSKVDGVTSYTLVPKATEFTVVGDFSPKQLFDEMNKVGLTGTVAAPAK
jgi:copper chaperone CopZ